MRRRCLHPIRLTTSGDSLRENGFEIEAWYGCHDHQPFTDTSERMVIIARRSRNRGTKRR